MDFCQRLSRMRLNPQIKMGIGCLILFLAISLPLRAAVVEAEDVPRYVDTPTGTVLVEGIPEPPPRPADFRPEAPVTTQSAPKAPEKSEASPDLPEAPSFEAEVEERRPESDNNRLFLVLGLIIIIVGLLLVFYIANKRRDNE